MAVKIEGVPVRKGKVQLDSKSRISPPELSYFLLLFRQRSNFRNDQWASKLFQMIRSLDAQRMPRAVCLWEIRSEDFLKSNCGSAADPIKLDLFVTKLLWPVSLYWADAFRNVANYNKNKIIIICRKEYSVTCCRGQGGAGQGRAGQGRAQCFPVGMKAATFVWNWPNVKNKFLLSSQWKLYFITSVSRPTNAQHTYIYIYIYIYINHISRALLHISMHPHHLQEVLSFLVCYSYKNR